MLNPFISFPQSRIERIVKSRRLRQGRRRQQQQVRLLRKSRRKRGVGCLLGHSSRTLVPLSLRNHRIKVKSLSKPRKTKRMSASFAWNDLCTGIDFECCPAITPFTRDALIDGSRDRPALKIVTPMAVRPARNVPLCVRPHRNTTLAVDSSSSNNKKCKRQRVRALQRRKRRSAVIMAPLFWRAKQVMATCHRGRFVNWDRRCWPATLSICRRRPTCSVDSVVAISLECFCLFGVTSGRRSRIDGFAQSRAHFCVIFMI
mmetsp:Transcript_15586/g.35721  ORF Transcript_15586/g.35721 Transcript_15586/m.35721 type:complete len:259 (+) Transcript_15586:1495-2271(+)